MNVYSKQVAKGMTDRMHGLLHQLECECAPVTVLHGHSPVKRPGGVAERFERETLVYCWCRRPTGESWRKESKVGSYDETMVINIVLNIAPLPFLSQSTQIDADSGCH